MRTEDGDLVRQCINGDETAFGFLVDRYKEAVYASAYAKLRNFADAEDLTQEVFIKAYQNLRSVKYYDRFRAWLYAITANLSKNFLRSKASRPDQEFVEGIEQEVLDRPAMETYRKKQTYEPLYEALDELPEIYRQVLSLYYLGGMKSKEISQFLGTSVTNINTRLSRARSLLKEEMITMMSTTFDEMRLQPGFTFRIVEAIKQTKIQAPPSKMTLPFGISATAGLVALLLSLSIPYSPLYPIGQLIGSALPSQIQVSEGGVIPVDTIKVTEIVSLSPEMDDGDFGKKPTPEQTPMFGVGTWERKADMQTARLSSSTVVVDEKLYVIGGYVGGGGQIFSTLEVYDPLKDTWVTKADMPTPRFRLATSVVEGIIYAIGGTQDNFADSDLGTVEAYDPTTNTWTEKAEMPTQRHSMSASNVDGKIYVIGGGQGPVGNGANAVTIVPQVEVYDPVRNTWVKKPDMPAPRGGHTASVVNGKIYLAGGVGNGQTWLHAVAEYAPDTDTWENRAEAKSRRVTHAAGVINNRIYLFGGASGWGAQTNLLIEEYNPLTDEWAQKGNIPTPRTDPSSGVVNGKAYVIGGWNGIAMSVVEEFDVGFVENPQSVNPTGKLTTTWGEVKAKN